jgi:hypothetical protein
MISEITLQALQLLIRWGNILHCLPVEWCMERRIMKSLETNKAKWRLNRAVIVIHILLRILIIVSGVTAFLVENKGVAEVLLTMLFVAVFVLTLAFLFEVLFRHENTVEACNTTLSANYMMGQQNINISQVPYLSSNKELGPLLMYSLSC